MPFELLGKSKKNRCTSTVMTRIILHSSIRKVRILRLLDAYSVSTTKYTTETGYVNTNLLASCYLYLLNCEINDPSPGNLPLASTIGTWLTNYSSTIAGITSRVESKRRSNFIIMLFNSLYQFLDF